MQMAVICCGATLKAKEEECHEEKELFSSCGGQWQVCKVGVTCKA